MRLHRVALAVGTSVFLLDCASLIPVARAQTPGQPPAAGEKAKPKAEHRRPRSAEPSAEIKAVTQAILDEIDKNSELMANIEYLCDMIGPRLTGSPGLTRANHWTRDKFKQYGLANVHLEPWTIHRAWTRGEAKGRVVGPRRAAAAPGIGRLGPIDQGAAAGPGRPPQGRVDRGALPLQGEAQGGLGRSSPVSVQPSPKQPEPASPVAAMMRRMRDFPKMMQFNQELKKFLVAEGAAGLLRDSNKEHGLVNMTGATSNYTEAPYPEVFLTTESYGLIWRLLKRGPVEIEIDLKNSFSDGPVEVYNTVAEIPGTEKPDEVVIIGGHIDSWDLGTGATDDGTGIMAVLEAARLLKAVGVKPRRTIRFVMFSGEEQGLHGSRAYAKAHEKEMSKISAVLVHDMGTGRVKSIGLLGRYDLREIMDQVVEPFRDAVKLDELSLRGMAGGPTTPRSCRWACRRSRWSRTRPSIARPTTPRATPSTRCTPTRSTRGRRSWRPGRTTWPCCRDPAPQPQAGPAGHVRRPPVPAARRGAIRRTAASRPGHGGPGRARTEGGYSRPSRG